jgi:DNA-directed RNA polymerase specialized sigma subunit
MTKSELRDRLDRISDLDTRIRIMDVKIERYEATAQGHAIRYDVDKVQTSASDPVAAAIEKLSGLLDARRRLQVELTAAIADVADLLECVSDSKRRLVMHYRYIGLLPWREIAQRMSYAERHVFRMHDEAFDEIFKKCQ